VTLLTTCTLMLHPPNQQSTRTSRRSLVSQRWGPYPPKSRFRPAPPTR